MEEGGAYNPMAMMEQMRQMGLDPDSLDPSNLALDAVKVNMPRTSFQPAPHASGCSETTYDWAQSTGFTTFYLPVPKNTRGREINCIIKPGHFTFGMKGQDHYIHGELGGLVDVSLSTWELIDGVVEVSLAKKEHREWSFAVKPSKETKANSRARPYKKHSGEVKSNPVVGRDNDTRRIENKSKSKDSKSWASEKYKYAPKRIADDSKDAASSGARKPTSSSSSSKWDKFDADQALADLENEDNPENHSWRVSKDPGVATVDCVGYQKSKEEVALDTDLAAGVKRMKSMLRIRLANAQQCKQNGNDLVKSKNWAEALRFYEDGSEQLGVAKAAAPLMSESLGKRVRELSTALINNASLCHLKLGQYKAAHECSKEVLKEDSANIKALCRNAAALIELGKDQLAKTALDKVQKLSPSSKQVAQLMARLEEKKKIEG